MTYVTIFLFYAGFFAVGTLAGRKYAATGTTDELLLAGNRLPIWLGTFTLIATWVGGGYINGTAEAVYDTTTGLVWTQSALVFRTQPDSRRDLVRAADAATRFQDDARPVRATI